MTQQEKILDKLTKIKAMAEGAKELGNEAEAQAFAAMLQTLLLKHKLQMTDIEYAAEMKDEPIVEKRPDLTYRNGKIWYKDFPDMEAVNRRRLWAERLANIVGQAYACQILVVTGRSYIVFVGHASNVAIAEYLFLTMLRAAERMSETAAKAFRAQHRAEHGAGATPAGYRESWLIGFATRIAERLEAERNSFAQVANQSTALVRVNKEAIAVRSYMDKFKKKASAIGGRRDFNRDGYEKGKNAANNINIRNNAVNGGGQANKQLN